MWRWTTKALLMSPLSLAASVAAAALAFLLVMLFEAVYAGEAKQIGAYIEAADADVWVMQSGVANMHMATSYLQDWKVAEISRVPDVDAVEAILYLNTVTETAGARWFSFVVGLDVPSRHAGPWAIAEGLDQPGYGEAIVPAAFAAMTGLGLGDPIRIADREFIVVGLSREAFSMSNSLIFVTRRDLEDIMTSLDIVSYVLVKTAPGADPAAVAARIKETVDNVSALPAAMFAENDRRLAMQMGAETIALMTVIGAAVAMLLVAFTIYSQVARLRPELAVAKALGASNGALYTSVTIQAAVITGTGVVFAVLLAIVLLSLITNAVPQLALHLTGAAVGRVVVIGMVVALLAAFIPARQIARVDPLSAFRGH